MDRRCNSCGAHLSRYNTGLVCAACSGGSGSGSEMSWRSPDIREALANGDLGQMLWVIRRDAGMSQLEMGQVLGWSASQVHRVERGERQSLYDVRVLLQVCDALHMPRDVLKPLWRDASQEGDNAMDMSRREFARVMLGAAALGALPLTAAAADSGVPARADSTHLRALRATADRLYDQDQIVGGGALLEDAVQHLNRGRRILNESEFTERIGEQLMTAVGELAVCTGWLAFDAGSYEVARALYFEAIALADEAGADDLSVRAREKLALLAVQTARLTKTPATARQALRLTGRAIHTASHADPRVHALLASREAIGHATLGDRFAYQRAITNAWRELERDHGDPVPAWLQFMVSAELSGAEAKGRLYLGDATGAVELYEQALANANSPRNQLIYRAQRSAAIALTGDLATAVSEGLAVLPALGKVASPRTLRELSPVRDAAVQLGDDELVHQYDSAASKLLAA